MKRYHYCLLICLILISACAEDDGLTTRIQKVSVVPFELNTEDDTTDEGELIVFENVNLVHKEYASYLDQIKGFEINRIAFVVKRIVNDNRSIAPPVFTKLQLDMRGMNDAELQSFFTLRDIPFGEPTVFEIYKRDSVHASDVERAANLIRAKSMLKESLVLKLTGNLPRNTVDQNYELELLIDLNAIVGLR